MFLLSASPLLALMRSSCVLLAMMCGLREVLKQVFVEMRRPGTSMKSRRGTPIAIRYVLCHSFGVLAPCTAS